MFLGVFSQSYASCGRLYWMGYAMSIAWQGTLVCFGQVGNVECVKPDRIKFDFLGKDSMRYENETAVDLRVFKLMAKFCEGASISLCVLGKQWAILGTPGGHDTSCLSHFLPKKEHASACQAGSNDLLFSVLL